jgi:7,8-dihydropterin-6-yl-methyl-4-(beta-D-ribofuranosyl)aminobenzene 5'-phosphate synthase
MRNKNQTKQSGSDGSEIEMNDVRFTIVYDNIPYKSGLITGWGFSCFIETPRGNILFDTGWNGNILLNNLNKLNIDPKSIDKLVLSHSHWDHIGGVNHFIAINSELKVIIPTSFSKHLKDELYQNSNVDEVYEPEEVLPNCWTLGEMGRNIKEQSLMIKTKNGYIVVTGCSHPGLENVLLDARNHGKVYGVLGGFHGFNKLQVLTGLGFIMPCHCTQHIEEIELYHHKSVVLGGVGKKVTL